MEVHCDKSPKHTQKRQKITLLVASIVLLYIYAFPTASAPVSSQRSLLISSENARELQTSSCVWKPPNHNIPNDIEWYKTVVAGYPSGDKRLTFMQLEALTGWGTRDSWAFETFGMTNHPFIKTNFPHHDGVWGFDGKITIILFYFMVSSHSAS